ncbi:rhodanese-like domain-containing protein [Geomicrobium sp. JSM 1781026]|uniref:rhodanese-like domain-containing protein n=1 Tax=Geomicrobium sp. JSM 1781026 TaxID=3344580 RepID=UPI0035BF171E
MTYAIIVVLIIGFVLIARRSQKGIEQMTTTELKERLNESHIQLVDVRTEGEFKGRKIKKAKNMPLHELGKNLNYLRKDELVIVICQSGVRSRKAAAMLKKAGFNNVANVKGGMNAWSG